VRERTRLKVEQLGFLFGKIHVNHTILDHWLSITKFVDAIYEKYMNSETIDDRVVYDVMCKVFNENKRLTTDKLAKRGIDSLKKILESDENQNRSEVNADEH